MSESKRRRAEDAALVWHHTSILRTNRIWMSGVIEVEGKSEGVEHPAFGPIYTDPTARRALKDFPAVAWFTSDIAVPKCLQHFEAIGMDRKTGAPKRLELGPDAAAAFALNRIAIGFPIADIPVVPWPDYYGYQTEEGRDLNESARDVGDDPDRWWVSETPVDVLRATAIRSSKDIMKPKLERDDRYLPQVHRMVRLCQAIPETIIPPSWVGSPAHTSLIANGGSVGNWDHLAHTGKRT